MKRTCPCPPLAAVAVFAIFLCFFPDGAGAVDRRVPEDFTTIQAAITAAAAGDSVVVGPGTYQEIITLKEGVTVRGLETARTFLSGGGGGPVMTANGPVAAGIRNFTFINATTGVQVTGNPSVLSITNSVFEAGAGSTAILIQGSLLTEVVNNVFYQNGTAVNRDADVKIVNNIFAGNTTAIAGAGALAANIANNAFSGNIDSGPTGTAAVSGDPLFVDPGNHDFHLREFSPCIDAGAPSAGNDIIDVTPPDIGAYGGPNADLVPFPVAGLAVTFITDTSIDLAWLPNNSYHVTNLNFTGGYNLYYGYESGSYNGTDAEGGASPSPIPLGPEPTSFPLIDLAPSFSAIPSTPVLGRPVPGDGQLTLSWSASPGATGYNVHYGVASTGENTIDAGNTTSYPLTGLTNGQLYRVAVSAYAPPVKYFIAVTAVDSTVIELGNTPIPGVQHESAFSPELSVQLGPTPESGLSNVQTDFPEPGRPQPYPALPGGRQGCFIATAAYGYYSAPQVRALRAFRDRYLLTTAPGRRFVQWYYRKGPVAAEFLNAHPGYKPAVRAALMPAVGAAVFLTRTSATTKAGMLLFIGSAIAFGFYRKRRSGSGGLR